VPALTASSTPTPPCTSSSTPNYPTPLWFARDHVKIATHGTIDGPVLGAWVRSWDKLLADPEAYLSGTERRLVAIAASFACGHRLDLSAQVTMDLGRAGAQLAAKAMLIAAGAVPLEAADRAGPPASRYPGLPGGAAAQEGPAMTTQPASGQPESAGPR
jgi:hypothetical protein